MTESKSGSGTRPSRAARLALNRAGQFVTILATAESGTQSISALASGPAARSSAILCSVGLPRSTTELARELGLSAPTVSIDLSTLQRCGMVTSWRSGRRILYQRTPLATSVVAAAASGETRPDDYGTTVA
jgi:DNA-binding transcriptional ArsR family regulator